MSTPRHFTDLSAVPAAELEVTQWWTSAGEAAAVAEVARVFEEETGHTWVDSALAGTVRTRQFQSALFGAFAAATLLLLAVGIAGAIAMNTAARTREIGVRMALGATAPGVRRMVVAENLLPVVAGLLLGVAASWWTAGLLASLIYGVGSHNPVLWALAALLVLTTATFAAWLSAWPASRVDPQTVLRAQ